MSFIKHYLAIKSRDVHAVHMGRDTQMGLSSRHEQTGGTSPALLTSALDISAWSASAALPPREESPLPIGQELA